VLTGLATGLLARPFRLGSSPGFSFTLPGDFVQLQPSQYSREELGQMGLEKGQFLLRNHEQKQSIEPPAVGPNNYNQLQLMQ
jgi:hypothetical protein